MVSGDKTKIKKRILYVEDDVHTAEFMVRLLGEEGFDCFSAGSVVEALAVLEKVSPDLVIMDLAIPYQSNDNHECEKGLELLEKIKRPTSSPPVIVCSVWHVVDVVHRCYRLGATNFLAKPCTPKMLLTAVNEAIAKPHSPTLEPQEGSAELSRALLPELLRSTLVEITGAFCHDIANAIAGLYLYVEHAREKSPELDPRILAIASDSYQAVLDFQQFIGSFYKPDLQPGLSLTIADIEPALWSMVRGVVDLTAIDLRIEVLPYPEELRVPRILLRHLVTPVLANANKAIKSKSEPSGRISLTLGPLDELGDLRLVITDDGPGWANKLDEIKGRLRNMTFHFTAGRPGGYGLINVNRLVRGLEGSLILSESPWNGAQVEIRLPRKVCYAKTKSD